MVLQIEKYFKRRSAANSQEHTPIQLNVPQSIGWSERKRKQNYSKTAAKLKYKRMVITTMRNKFQSLATFHNPIHSHWSLPLRRRDVWIVFCELHFLCCHPNVQIYIRFLVGSYQCCPQRDRRNEKLLFIIKKLYIIINYKFYDKKL